MSIIKSVINNFISNNQILFENNEFLCKFEQDSNIFGQVSYKDC